MPLIVGEAAVALAGDAFDFVELDRIAVRGKSEPLAIHAVKGLA